ncbi:MAG TPA: PIN domain-containing protein [Chloroflexia bacterium]
MSLNLMVRFIGMLLFAAAGLVLGLNLSSVMPPETPGSFNAVVLYLPLLGALLGFTATPFLTVYPLRALRRRLRTASGGDVASAAFGLFVGLLLGALLGWPLSTLPDPAGQIAPTVGALVLAFLGLYVAVLHRHDLSEAVHALRAGSPGRGASQPRMSFTDTSTLSGKLAAESVSDSDRIQVDKYLLVDTSAIIDGRIADISKTGFIDGTLLVPRFVLNELQHIADSADPLRRARGRRGLDMLNRLQKEAVVPIQVSEVDAEDVPDVDSKLVKIARVYHCPVITNDFNLNRVAEIQGVKVLNINELANAIKPVVLPGEEMNVHVIQEGKELGQGIAYLDDGTMIVVENGRKYINSDVDVTVTRVLQTVAGRMIFAQMKNGKGSG